MDYTIFVARPLDKRFRGWDEDILIIIHGLLDEYLFTREQVRTDKSYKSPTRVQFSGDVMITIDRLLSAKRNR